MKLGDLFPNPKDLNPLKMFKSRDGHPWLQSVARNVMQSQVGEKNANKLNEKFLGDSPQTTPQAGFSGLLSTTPQVGGPTTGGAPAQKQNNGADLMTLLQALGQKQGGM